MPRTRKGAKRRQTKQAYFKKAKGNYGTRRRQWRRVQEAVTRAGAHQYQHRREIKRDYRRLWITRISAACKQRGMNYSRFIAGLKRANIILNRKMLSEVAIHHPEAFDKLAEQSKAALEAEPQSLAA